jgi:uncharacterized protein YutE (UPF0331/DUF86 family)
MLNNEFVNRKIRLIQKDIDRLGSFVKEGREEVVMDYFKMNNIERMLEKIINRAIDINQHIVSRKGKGDEKLGGYEDTFYAMADIGVFEKDFAEKIAPSAGLRNRLVHEYDDIDKDIVFDSAVKAVGQYTKYCDYTLKFIS